MIEQNSSEVLAILRETVRSLENDASRNGVKPPHIELKRLLQRRIVELEAAASQPEGDQSTSDIRTAADQPSSLG